MNLSAQDLRKWSSALTAQPKSPGDFMNWVVGPLRNFFPFQRVFMVHGEFVAGEIKITHWQADGHEQSFLDQKIQSFDIEKRGALAWWLSNRKPFYIDPISSHTWVTELEIDEINKFALANVAAHGTLNVKASAGTYFSFAGIPEPLSAWHLDALRIITPVLNDLYLAQMAEQSAMSYPVVNMTLRQKIIVRSVVSGKDDKTIAREQGIAVQTVKNQLSQIYQQLGIHKRSELIVILR